MNGSLSRPRFGYVPALLLGLFLAACQGQPDPCTSSDYYQGKAVACRKGTNVRVLAELPTTVEEWSNQVASSEHPVALDHEYVYWSDYKGRILRTPKAGGATDVLLEPSACTIADLAVDEVGIYFGQNCEIPERVGIESFPVESRVSWLDKESGERHELAAHKLVDVRELVVRDGVVYWTQCVESETCSLQRLRRGLAPEFAGVVVPKNSRYLLFALSDERVLWLDSYANELQSAPLQGSHGEPLTSTMPWVDWLALAGETVFWTEHNINEMGATARHLFRVPWVGGEATEPLAGLVPEFMATDGVDYYGAGNNSGTTQGVYRLYRWRAPAFELDTLAAGLSGPESIAIDDTHVYVRDLELFERHTLRLLRVSR